MTNRREFLQATALIGLPMVSGTPQSAVAARASLPPRSDLHTFLLDERHWQARSVGAAFAGAGTSVRAIPDGDITQIWLREIGPEWKRHRGTVAGLTARPALFCLEQLALTCGMRVAFHAEHIVHPDGRTEHSLLRGADSAHLSLDDLSIAGALWPLRIADAIATYRPLRDGQRLGPSDAALEPALPEGAQLLTSWIIASA
jgi:hypothetical protein